MDPLLNPTEKIMECLAQQGSVFDIASESIQVIRNSFWWTEVWLIYHYGPMVGTKQVLVQDSGLHI